MNTPTLTITKNADGSFTGVVTNGTVCTTTQYRDAADVRSRLLSQKQSQLISSQQQLAQQTVSIQSRIDAATADIATINAALAE